MTKVPKGKIFTFRNMGELDEYRKECNRKQNECAKRMRERKKKRNGH